MPILHMLETPFDVVFSLTPGFQALIRHPVFIFGNPGRTVSGSSPENELRRIMVKTDHDVRIPVNRPEIIPSGIVFQFRIKSPKMTRVLFNGRQPPRLNIRHSGLIASKNRL